MHPQQNAARVELMAAELGHQPLAGALAQSPAHQLFEALIPVAPEIHAAILSRDLGEPRVPIALFRAGTAALGLIAMPKGADVPHVAENVLLLRDLQRVRVQIAVVPLMPDR